MQSQIEIFSRFQRGYYRRTVVRATYCPEELRPDRVVDVDCSLPVGRAIRGGRLGVFLTLRVVFAGRERF